MVRSPEQPHQNSKPMVRLPNSLTRTAYQWYAHLTASPEQHADGTFTEQPHQNRIPMVRSPKQPLQNSMPMVRSPEQPHHNSIPIVPQQAHQNSMAMVRSLNSLTRTAFQWYSH